MSSYFTPEVYEETFGVALAVRFRTFLVGERETHDGKLATLPTYAEAIEVWFDGSELESFVSEDWPETDDEGNPYGHPSATEIDFEDFAGWVPLATIGMEESQVLLCNASMDACPVAMWEHETGELVPVADSLDDLIAGLVDA